MALMSALAAVPFATARADDEQPDRPAVEELRPAVNKYRIGLGCAPVSEAMSAQLGLDEGQGLLVQEVLEGSPSDRAGLKRFDVLLEVDGTPLTSVTDLVDAVNKAQLQEITLKVLRRGDEQLVRVTPEERPEGEVPWGAAPDAWRQFEGMPPEVRRYLEQFDLPVLPELGRRGFGWQQFGPGIVIDGEDGPGSPGIRPQLPNNFSLRIEKSDQGPAKIHVQRGNEKWEVTEDNLDALPEDLRDLVKSMLGGSQRGVFGLNVPRPLAPNRVPRLPRLQPRENSNMEQRFDEMSIRLKELQEAIESLRNEK